MIAILRTFIILLTIISFKSDLYAFDVDKDILKYNLYKLQKVSAKNTFGEAIEKLDSVYTGRTIGDVFRLIQPHSSSIKSKISLIGGVVIEDNKKFSKGWPKFYYEHGKPIFRYSHYFNIKQSDNNINMLLNDNIRVIITYDCNYELQRCDSFEEILSVPFKSTVKEDFKSYDDVVNVKINEEEFFINILNSQFLSDLLHFEYSTNYDKSYDIDRYVKVLKKYRLGLPYIKLTGAYGPIRNDSDILKVSVRIRDTIEQAAKDEKNNKLKYFEDNNVPVQTTKYDNDMNDIHNLILSGKYEEALKLCESNTPKDNPDNCIYSSKKAFILAILNRNDEAFKIFQKNINRVCEDKNKSLWQDYIKETLSQMADIRAVNDKNNFNRLYKTYTKTVSDKSNEPVW